MIDEGFSKPLVLPDSHKHDSVLCVELADVDWDGQDEIVLGTFGKVICMCSCVSINTHCDNMFPNYRIFWCINYSVKVRAFISST